MEEMIPGLHLVPDFVSPENENYLMQQVDSQSWSSALSRRTQQYGFTYDYSTRKLTSAPPFPEWATKIANHLVTIGVFNRPPNQLIVNEYVSGQGIASHTDSKLFGNPIVSISLHSSVEMEMTSPTGEVIPIKIPSRSMLVLSGEARWKWKHGIRAKTREPDWCRVSLTFRLTATP